MTTSNCFNCLHSRMNILFGIAYQVCENHGFLTPYNESLRDCKDFKSKTENFEPSDEFIEKLLNECEGILPDCELWDTPEKMKAVAKDVLSDYDKESDYIKGLKHEMEVDDDT